MTNIDVISLQFIVIVKIYYEIVICTSTSTGNQNTRRDLVVCSKYLVLYSTKLLVFDVLILIIHSFNFKYIAATIFLKFICKQESRSETNKILQIQWITTATSLIAVIIYSISEKNFNDAN